MGLTLAVIGLFFEPADIVDGALSAARGDVVGAALSATAIVPVAGATANAAKATRYARRLGLVADVLPEVTKIARAKTLPYNQLGSLIEELSGALPRARAFLADADPARKVLGPARLSHADEIAEMRRIMEAEGVRVIERPNAMAYGPSSRAGEPGQFFIDPDASYSAWKHEYRHFTDDRASGWDGMSVLMDSNARWAWESAAYAEEISMMRRLGRQDVVDELIKLRTKEWQNIFMPHLRK